MVYEKELRLAIRSVKKAAELCRNVQNTLVNVEAIEKEDRSPVTIADLGTQAVINSNILQGFPGDPVVAEEEAGLLRENSTLREKVFRLVSDAEPGVNEKQMLDSIDYGAGKADFRNRYWTLDPIDGTKGFLRGQQYAIALALIEDGQVVLGALGCPNLMVQEGAPDKGKGCLFFAVKGQGTRMIALDNDIQSDVTVDGFSDPARARFCESVEKAHASHETHARISAMMGIQLPPYRIDSQCKYAAVARGDASVYLRLPRSREYREKIWDHAAGVIVVREAGGKVTDFSGKPLDFSLGRKLSANVGILATNGSLHQTALDAIKEVVEL